MSAWVTILRPERSPTPPKQLEPAGNKTTWATVIKATTKLKAAVGISKRPDQPVEWRVFKDVDVVGIDAVLDTRAPLMRRVLWACMLCVSLSLMLAQCFNCVKRYVDEPVNVNFRVAQNDTLTFPAVTLCNRNLFNMTAALELLIYHGKLPKGSSVNKAKVEMLVGVDNMTSTDVWKALAHKFDQFVIECMFGPVDDCRKRGKWSQVFTVTGPCYTYILDDAQVNSIGSSQNMNLVFEETEPVVNKDEEGVRILVHDPLEPPTILARTKAISSKLGTGRDLKLEIRQFNALNTAKAPCNDVEGYLQSQCQANCFEETMLNITKCRMPYMSAPQSANVSECSTPKEYTNGLVTVQKLLFSGGWSAINNCSCLHQCIQTNFLNFPEVLSFKPQKVKLSIFYQDLVFEEVAEERAYPVISLLCDIGGTLGLLMGASVLTVCELLEVAWSRVLSICNRIEERRPQATPPTRSQPPNQTSK